jgi:hypothetical protein
MKKHILALAERVSATFLFAFLGIVVISNGHDIKAVEAGAIAGGLSVAKYAYTAIGAYLSAPPGGPPPAPTT